MSGIVAIFSSPLEYISLEYTTWHHLTEKSALISIEITLDICLLLSTSGKTCKTQDMEYSGLDKLNDNIDVTVEYDIFYGNFTVCIGIISNIYLLLCTRCPLCLTYLRLMPKVIPKHLRGRETNWSLKYSVQNRGKRFLCDDSDCPVATGILNNGFNRLSCFACNYDLCDSCAHRRTTVLARFTFQWQVVNGIQYPFH